MPDAPHPGYDLLLRIRADIIDRKILDRAMVDQLLALPMPATPDQRWCLLQRQSVGASLAYHLAHAQGDTAARDIYRAAFVQRITRMYSSECAA